MGIGRTNGPEAVPVAGHKAVKPGIARAGDEGSGNYPVHRAHAGRIRADASCRAAERLFLVGEGALACSALP
jgi:hypothetical protein